MPPIALTDSRWVSSIALRKEAAAKGSKAAEYRIVSSAASIASKS
jgi:hypothetical protein